MLTVLWVSLQLTPPGILMETQGGWTVTIVEVAFLGSSEITYSKLGAHIIEVLALMTKEG